MPHTQFSTALKNKNSALLIKLIQKDLNLLQFVDEQGDTLLHHAIDWGNPVFVKFLLEQGARPSIANKLGEEPLHVALQQADASVFLQLLRENLQEKLYKIPKSKNDKIEKSNSLLVEKDDDSKSKSDSVQLHVANQPIVVSHEQEHIKPRKAIKNQEHFMPLLLGKVPTGMIMGQAYDQGDCFFDALAQLINGLNKANINISTAKYLRMLCHDFYSKNKELVDEWNAAEFGSIDNQKAEYYMVQYTADECDKHFNGKPPIWGRPYVEGKILCCQLQLEAICVIEILEEFETKKPVISFHLINSDSYKSISEEEAGRWISNPKIPTLVVEQNSLHFVPLMPETSNSQKVTTAKFDKHPPQSFEKEAYIERVNLHPLHLHEQVLRGTLEKSDIDLLLGPKVLTYWTDKANYTPLHIAAALGNQEIVQQCIDNSNPEEWLTIKNNRGQTPLLLAAKHGHLGVIQCLLHADLGVRCQRMQLNTFDEQGNHILHYLAVGNTQAHVNVLKSLFNKNMKNIYSFCLDLVGCHNKSEVLPLQLAIRTGRLEIFVNLFNAACESAYSKMIKEIISANRKERNAIFKKQIASYYPTIMDKLIKLAEIQAFDSPVKSMTATMQIEYEDSNEIHPQIHILEQLISETKLHQDPNEFKADDELAMTLLNIDCQIITSHFDTHTFYYWAGFYGQFSIFNWLMTRWQNCQVLLAEAFLPGGRNNTIELYDSLVPTLREHFIAGINAEEPQFYNRVYWDLSGGNYSLEELKNILKKMEPFKNRLTILNFSNNNFDEPCLLYLLHWVNSINSNTSDLMSLDLSGNVIASTNQHKANNNKVFTTLKNMLSLNKLKYVYLINTQLKPEDINHLKESCNNPELEIVTKLEDALQLKEKEKTESLAALPSTTEAMIINKDVSTNIPIKSKTNYRKSHSNASSAASSFTASSSLVDAYSLDKMNNSDNPPPRNQNANVEDESDILEIHVLDNPSPQTQPRKKNHKRQKATEKTPLLQSNDANKEKKEEYEDNDKISIEIDAKVDILTRYQEPGFAGKAIRRWLYSVSLQNLVARTSNLCCPSRCCDRCKSNPEATFINDLNDQVKINQSEKKSSKKVFAPLSGTNSPSIFQSRFAPFAYFADPMTRRVAHFIEGFIDHFNWMLEKSWLMVLSAFIYKGLHDYFRMPGWQRQRINLFNLLVAKTVEERLASYVDNGTIYGALLGAASFMGLLGGITKTIKQGRRFQPHEVEALKLEILYKPHHPFMHGLHEVLEILEIPAVISLLVLAPPVVFSLFLFKLKHLFKPGALEDLKYAVLWDTGLSISQRSELFDVLLRACQTHRNLGQMEAVAVLADIIYHLNLKQLDTLEQQLNNPDWQARYPEVHGYFRAEQRQTIDILRAMKRQGLQVLNELAHTPTKYGHCLGLGRLHPRALNARYHLWRLGMETDFKTFISMIPLYLYGRIPRLASFGLFAYTIGRGIYEKYQREHEAHECHEHHLQWRYVPSVGEYVCSPCSDLPIPYRYMQTNDLCIQGFLNDSRTLEQWNTVLNRLNFANFSEINLSGQSQLIQQGQLPILLNGLAAKARNTTALILNNKFDGPYILSAEDYQAIGNFTQSFASFNKLELQYQDMGSVLNGTQLGEFAASLHPDLQELILSHNQLGFQNTSLFFKNLPRNLEYLDINNNGLNDQDGQALIQTLLQLEELIELNLSNNPKITDKSGVTLVSQLKQHKNLMSLGLSFTGIGDGTALEFNNANLSATFPDNLIVNINQCPQLTDQGGLAFAQALSKNVSFAALIIADNNNLTQTTLGAITDALSYVKQPLKGFGVGSILFTNIGGLANYFNVLRLQSDLFILDLSSTPLTSASNVLELATAIAKLPKLHQLILANTQLVDTSFKQLLPILKHSAIQTLILRNNPDLTDASIQALIAEPPINLQRLDLSGNNFTLINAESLGQLLHKVPLTELQLAYNRLELQFMSRFAPYLPGSPLQALGLSNCGLADQDALDLAEVLTEYQIPDDWLGSFDSDTIRSLAKGNPGTNLSLIDISFNTIGNIGAKRLCQVLPGTKISVNQLILQNNPINASVLKNCGDLGLMPSDSPGNHLLPAGPYVWLKQLLQTWYTKQPKAKASVLPQHFPITKTIGTRVKAVLASRLSDLDLSIEQLQNCHNADWGQAALSVAVIPNRDRELHIINTSCEEIAANFRARHPMTEQNSLASFSTTASQTAVSFLSGAGYAIALTGLPNIGTSVLQQMGMAEERARAWAEGLQQLLSLALLIWRSPSYALATLILGATLYRLCPDRNTARFLQLMATILLLTVSELWQKNHSLEDTALQMTASGLGAIGGQVVMPVLVKCSKNLWQSYSCFWKSAQRVEEGNMQVEKYIEDSSQMKLFSSHTTN